MTPHDSLLAALRDPMTPGEVLGSALDFLDRMLWTNTNLALRNTALRNPNLPADRLWEGMIDGWPGAWLNPAAPLLLLERPMDEELRLRGLWVALGAWGMGLPQDRPHLADLQAMYPDDMRVLLARYA